MKNKMTTARAVKALEPLDTSALFEALGKGLTEQDAAQAIGRAPEYLEAIKRAAQVVEYKNKHTAPEQALVNFLQGMRKASARFAERVNSMALEHEDTKTLERLQRTAVERSREGSFYWGEL